MTGEDAGYRTPMRIFAEACALLRAGPSAREWWLAGILGVLLRALTISVVVYGLGGDAEIFQPLARNLAEHGVFSIDQTSIPAPCAIRAPLFPAFVALVQVLSGTVFLGLQFAQTALSVAGAIVLARAVGRWVPEAQRLVLWGLCLLPYDGFYCGTMLTEALTTTLLAAAMATLLTRRDWIAAAGAGVFLGFATLTRDIFLPVSIVIAVGLLVIVRPSRRSLGRRCVLSAVMIGATLGVIAPWTVRNAIQLHALIPVSRAERGYNLWIGTWERNGRWMDHGHDFPPYAFRSAEEQTFVLRLDQERTRARTLEGDRAFEALAVDRIRQHPLRAAATWIERFPRMWIGTRCDLFTFRPRALQPGRPLWTAVKVAMWGLNAAIVLAGTVALVLPWRGRRRTGLLCRILALPVVATAALYLPFHSTETRYSQPVLQFLVVAAAVLLSRAVATQRVESLAQVP